MALGLSSPKVLKVRLEPLRVELLVRCRLPWLVPSDTTPGSVLGVGARGDRDSGLRSWSGVLVALVGGFLLPLACLATVTSGGGGGLCPPRSLRC